MKRLPVHFFRILFCLVLPLRAQWDYLPYTAGHVDVGMRLESGQLEGFWKNDGATIHGDPPAANPAPPALRALAVFDENTPPLLRPASSVWDFLGVSAGDPIYILPSSGLPNTLPYLGFSTEHPSLSSFATLRFTLSGMTGPAGGVFSLFTSSSNVPMNTLSGFPAGFIEMEPGEHLHYNWAFSKPGTYDLTFLFEAFDENATRLHSGSGTFRFHITTGTGYRTYHEWRITQFRPEEIPNDAISGPAADPHGLGIPNQQIYTFGSQPRVELLNVLVASSPRFALRFSRRVGATDMRVQLQSSPTLASPLWTEVVPAVEHERLPVFHDPGLEDVTLFLPAPGDAPLFFRIASPPEE